MYRDNGGRHAAIPKYRAAVPRKARRMRNPAEHGAGWQTGVSWLRSAPSRRAARGCGMHAAIARNGLFVATATRKPAGAARPIRQAPRQSPNVRAGSRRNAFDSSVKIPRGSRIQCQCKRTARIGKCDHAAEAFLQSRGQKDGATLGARPFNTLCRGLPPSFNWPTFRTSSHFT